MDKTRALGLVAAACCAAFALGHGGPGKPAKAASKTKTEFGQSAKIGKGTVRTWVRTRANGAVDAIGITFSDSAFDGLPAPNKAIENPDFDTYVFPLALPKSAASTVFTHAMVDYNPQGHSPKGIYTIAHFDLHFYMIPQAEREQITAQGDDLTKCRKQPAAKFMPKGYMFAPDTEVPKMGAHWVDTATPELHGKTFTYTLIYGSYNGKVAFVEPMVSRDFLLSKLKVEAPIPQPAAYQTKGKTFPKRYAIRHDDKKKETTICYEGFVKR